LCDFGLSTYLSPLYDVKTSFCGTLDYIAPEMKDVGVYDYSIDIWGLGNISVI
jgi:serine/threonine protein kinase